MAWYSGVFSPKEPIAGSWRSWNVPPPIPSIDSRKFVKRYFSTAAVMARSKAAKSISVRGGLASGRNFTRKSSSGVGSYGLMRCSAKLWKYRSSTLRLSSSLLSWWYWKMVPGLSPKAVSRWFRSGKAKSHTCSLSGTSAEKPSALSEIVPE